uniref:Ribosomal protein L15 n=1 Tax=Knipowitschia caucasica TaxID=637954 RepID=A0AAV2L1W9_KNICA
MKPEYDWTQPRDWPFQQLFNHEVWCVRTRKYHGIGLTRTRKYHGIGLTKTRKYHGIGLTRTRKYHPMRLMGTRKYHHIRMLPECGRIIAFLLPDGFIERHDLAKPDRTIEPRRIHPRLTQA